MYKPGLFWSPHPIPHETTPSVSAISSTTHDIEPPESPWMCYRLIIGYSWLFIVNIHVYLVRPTWHTKHFSFSFTWQASIPPSDFPKQRFWSVILIHSVRLSVSNMSLQLSVGIHGSSTSISWFDEVGLSTEVTPHPANLHFCPEGVHLVT